MQFDTTYTGFIAIGDRVIFRPLAGEDVDVVQTPPDVDSHALAAALNCVCNGVFKLITPLSNYKF